MRDEKRERERERAIGTRNKTLISRHSCNNQHAKTSLKSTAHRTLSDSEPRPKHTRAPTGTTPISAHKFRQMRHNPTSIMDLLLACLLMSISTLAYVKGDFFHIFFFPPFLSFNDFYGSFSSSFILGPLLLILVINAFEQTFVLSGRRNTRFSSNIFSLTTVI